MLKEMGTVENHFSAKKNIFYESKSVDHNVTRRLRKVSRRLRSFEKDRAAEKQRRKDLMVLGKRSDLFDQKLKEFSNFVIKHRKKKKLMKRETSVEYDFYTLHKVQHQLVNPKPFNPNSAIESCLDWIGKN